MTAVDSTALVPTSIESFDVSQYLNEEQKVTALAKAEGFDPVKDSSATTAFFAVSAKGLGDLADPLLQKVKTRDTGEVGKALSELMVNIQGLDPKILLEDQGPILAALSKVWILNRFLNKYYLFKEQYEDLEKKLDRLVKNLVAKQTVLNRDVAAFDLMTEQFRERFFNCLTDIYAAEIKRVQLIEEQKRLDQEASKSQNVITARDASKLNAVIHDLEISIDDAKRMALASLQIDLEFRILSQTDNGLVHAIQRSIDTGIPHFKLLAAAAIGAYDQQMAAKVEEQMRDTIDDLHQRVAEVIHQSAVATARANERPILSTQAIENAQKEIIGTLKDVLKVMDEGTKMRQEATPKLLAMTSEIVQVQTEFRARIGSS